ncbi:MAG: transglutaminase TgpA family protein [Gammaproteobacteria bacterium]
MAVSWAFVAIVVAVMPHASRFSLWLIMALITMGSWRVLGAYRKVPLPDRRYLLVWLIKQLVAVSIFVATYLSFDGQLGRDAGVAMLTALLGLKLLEMRTPRDFYIVMFLAYFLVVTNLFYSQTLFTAVYMLAVVVLVTAGLIHFNGSIGGLRIRQCFRLSVQYCLQALPIMVVAFILFPRIPGPLWGMPQNTADGVTGLSNEMTIGNISRLGTSDEIAFRVTFDGREPAARDLYWRGPVLWETNGITWRPGPAALSNRRRGPATVDTVNRSGEQFEYQTIIDAHGEKWIFALDHVLSVKPNATITADHRVLAPKRITTRQRYEIKSVLGNLPSELSTTARTAALQLPPDYHPQTVAMAKRWRTETNVDRKIIDKALRFFNQENFIYTLTPRSLGSDAVDSFLFETREGFCEYYASSFVILMRAAGIPARVVTGYQGGEYNTLSDFMLVRQRDAHAWAEVYLDNRGWVRVDPTSAVAPERLALGLSEVFPERRALSMLDADNPVAFTWHRIRDVWEAVNFGWSRWVLGYSPARQREFLDNLGLHKWDYGTLIIALTVAGAILMSVIALWLLRSTARDVDLSAMWYAKFCAKLAKAGFERAPHEGPRDFAARVGSADMSLSSEVDEITQLYVELRYAPGNNSIQLFAERVKSFSAK